MRLRAAARLSICTVELSTGCGDVIPVCSRVACTRDQQRRSRASVGKQLDGVGGCIFGWGPGVALLNVFPLPRQTGFRESFAYAGESVDRGYSILVFPEGHHTTDGKLRPFRAGVGLLANNLGIPVVPMRIDGLFELKKAKKKVAWPGTVRVKIGAPVKFQPESDPEWFAREVQKRVQDL